MYDVVIILGGGVAEGGAVPESVLARLDTAMPYITEGAAVITTSGYTVNKPPVLDERGFPYTDADIMGRELVRRGVPASKMYCEKATYDTIGNAYFSRVAHVEPQGFEHILVVTSEFHMPRSQAIFEWVYSLTPSLNVQLAFEAAPDTGLSEEQLKAREEKEAKSLVSVQQLAQRITTLKDFHQWLHTEHAAHVVGGQPKILQTTAEGTY